jgi:predicted xylose isomerase-like sugar epimerase
MTKIIPFKEGMATVGDDALKMMDEWKSDMVKHSKVVIIYSDASGAYNTYAVNCNMAEAIGYATMAQEMLINQVRPE